MSSRLSMLLVTLATDISACVYETHVELKTWEKQDIFFRETDANSFISWNIRVITLICIIVFFTIYEIFHTISIDLLTH